MDYKDCEGCGYLYDEYDFRDAGHCVLTAKPFNQVEVCPNTKPPISELKYQIYFSDLSEVAQMAMRETFGATFVEDGNYDVFPLAEFVYYL